MADGRAYLQSSDDPIGTQVLDPKTGTKKQTIGARLNGITTAGLLIDEHNSYQLTAYRWT